MSRKIIHSTYLSDFRPLLWKGIPVYKRIEGIKSILRERAEVWQDLFSDPLITDEANRNRESAYWRADVPDGVAARSYPTLTAGEQENVLARLRQALAAVSSIATGLKGSGNPDQAELGEVLELAFQIPADDCIYVVGDRVLLVLWGFVYKDTEKWKFSISRLLEGEGLAGQEGLPKEGSGQLEEQPQKLEEALQEEKKEGGSGESNDKRGEPEKKKQGEKNGGEKRRWRRSLWLSGLIALALLLLLLWWLWPKHHTPHLPPFGNRYMPFDTTKIVTDPDSKIGSQIVGNRLNAQIDPKVRISDFADRFKEKFPSDEEVRIIFYDTILHSVQIEFYKNDLNYWKSALSQFKECIRVYKETIYGVRRVPSDPGFRIPAVSYPYRLTGVYGAWDRTIGDKYIVVAVIDDGFDLQHPELNSRIFKPFNNSNGTGDVSVGIYTDNQHGTHVSALAVGNADNGWGVSGFAPGCEFMPIQVTLNNRATAGIMSAIYHAVNNGADVINLSLGLALPKNFKKPTYDEQINFIQNDPDGMMEAEVWEQVYRYADKFNCIIVQAAGNDDILSGIDPMKRSSLIIDVGACDAAAGKANFSDFGTAVSVTAPGVEIFSAIPGNKYAVWDGTSMASPIVAGGVALMKSVKHDLKVTEAKRILIETGIPVRTPGDRGDIMGPLVQFDKAIARLLGGNNDPCRNTTDSLIRVIDSLRQRIHDTTYLVIPPHVKDCAFAMGDWVSSNDLFNINTHESVRLLFRFNGNCQGTLFFLQKDKVCSAAITMNIENGVFEITQVSEAECDNQVDKYRRYYFECAPDENGVAECKAFAMDTKQQVINFKLYKN